MATFTMELHRVLGVDTPYDADASRIGLDRYPIWDEGYRGELNQKIIMRFWNREIGFETPHMFVHHMRRLMGEIMPYYNKLAESTLVEFDMFETVNVTTETEGEAGAESKGTSTTESASESTGTTESTSESTGTTESTSESTSSSEQQTATDMESESTEQSQSRQGSQSETAARNVNSDHPQTRLNEFEDYATSSAESVSESASQSDGDSSGTQSQTQTGSDTSTGSQTGSDTSTGSQTGSDTSTGSQTGSDTGHQSGETTGEQSQRHRDTSTQRGTQGNKSAMLQQYRDTILNVDTLILEELEVLFMGVWDTDQSYTRIETMNPYTRLLF